MSAPMRLDCGCLPPGEWCPICEPDGKTLEIDPAEWDTLACCAHGNVAGFCDHGCQTGTYPDGEL